MTIFEELDSMKPILVFCVVFGLICLPAFTCTAAVIHVPADQPTIQAGIDAAADGDTVLVADGTYTGEGNWDIDFKGKAITVTSENGPESCMIEREKGVGEHRGFFFHSFETHSSVLKGFTIKNCLHSAGGGILISNASPLIIQCVIDGNNSVHGGGLYIEHSNTALVQCSIIKNMVDGYWDGRGGAMIIENSDIEIDQCIIRDNRSIGYDNAVGGIICSQSNLLINKSLIIHNTSSSGRNNGGGFSISSSNVTVINSVIAKSSSSLNWGIVSVSNVTLINSVVADNWSYHGFSKNKSHFTLINCIVWGNSSNSTPHGDSTFDIRYSNIQGGWEGIGNINADPLFMGTANSPDYRLMPLSPCIDAGASENAPSTDLDGNDRSDGHVDMGAYEFYWPTETTTYVAMPTREFYPGDKTSCSVLVWNTTDDLPIYTKLFVILDVLGNTYFAPSFTSFDYFIKHFPKGLTEISIIPEFTWPPGFGEQSGLIWYAALTDPTGTEIWGDFGTFEFGWKE